MINEYIRETAFTTEAANDFYKGKFDGADSVVDKSLVSMLRAVIAPRMENDERVRVKTRSHYVSNVNDEAIRDAFTRFSSEDQNGLLYFLTIAGKDTDTKEFIDRASEYWMERHRDFNDDERVHKFLKNGFHTRLLVNPKKRTTLIICQSMNAGKMHALLNTVSAWFPWYWERKKVEPDEVELFKSTFKEASPAKFLDCLEKMAAKYNWEEERIRRMLKDIGETAMKQSIANAERRIADYENRIRDFLRQVKDLQRSRYSEQTTLLGLKAREGDNKLSEVADFLNGNKNYKLVSVNGTSVVFDAIGYLTYFDEDMAKKYVENHSSILYRYGNGMSSGDKEIFYRALFVDRSIKIRMIARFEMDFSGGVDANTYVDYKNNTRLPNPHLNFHSCMNENANVVNEAIMDGDYILAFEQCAASMRNLSLADGTVMEEFLRIICDGKYEGYSFDSHFVELPDGSVVTPTEAVEWLKKEAKAA